MLSWFQRRRERQASDEVVVPGLIHELRQPIMGVDAGLRLLGRELGDAVTTRESWRLATGQLARLNETLDGYAQLLDDRSGTWGAFDVAPVLNRAIEPLRPRLQRLGERFSLVIEDGVPRANGRSNALLHAVTNLCANALDALDEKGGDGRLEIRAVRARGDRPAAQVRVSDEGIGIPPEQRGRIFQPRYTTKPEGKGNGIGMTLSRRVLRACGGDLRLADDDDPLRRPWAKTEFVVDLAPLPAPAADASPSSGPRRWNLAALLAALVVVAGLGWIVMERRFPSAERTPAAARHGREAAVVTSGEGTLERRSAAGGWTHVGPGERLAADDTLRTSLGSKATLAVGDRSYIALSEATQLAVREITSAIQRLRLSRGRLSVDHQPDGARVIVVETERGDALARASAARFSVLSTGMSLAVATDAGVVRLQTARGAVDVKEGHQAVAFGGAAPETPAPISSALLLRVANDVSEGPPELCAMVKGTAPPGSEVRVDGERVPPTPDGRFTVRVARRRGMSSVRVVSRDVTGRIVERRVACSTIDPRLSDFAVRWGTR